MHECDDQRARKASFCFCRGFRGRKVSQVLKTSYNTADTLHVRRTGVPQPFSF